MWWRVKIILKSTVNMVKDKYERITDWDGIYIGNNASELGHQTLPPAINLCGGE